VLVVVQLAGGNDGLNTVVPITNDDYYKARPTMAVQKASALEALRRLRPAPKLRRIQEDVRRR